MLDLQQRLKDSLERTWKNSLSHDWIPAEKAKTFPLRDFYVGLRWIRVVKRAIDNFRKELNNIYDIFDVVDMSKRPKATNILVTGEETLQLLWRVQGFEGGGARKRAPSTKISSFSCISANVTEYRLEPTLRG